MNRLILFLAIVLSACAAMPELVKPEQVVVERVEYVVKIPPADLMTLPQAVTKIDVDSAKQSDVAKWILASEDRTRSLENLIIGIGLFFKVEQAKVLDAANIANKKAIEDAATAQAQTAIDATSKEVKTK